MENGQAWLLPPRESNKWCARIRAWQRTYHYQILEDQQQVVISDSQARVILWVHVHWISVWGKRRMKELRGKTRHLPKGSSTIQDVSPRKNSTENSMHKHSIKTTAWRFPKDKCKARDSSVDWILYRHLEEFQMSNHAINTTQQVTWWVSKRGTR